MSYTETTLPEEIVKEIENFGLQVARLKKKEIPEEKFKRFRLQHGIYGQRQKGVQMVRVKIPAGLLTAPKLRCLADIAERYSTGKGHVTTRQDVQFHFVKLDDVTSVMYRLAESGLTTREACGNTVRNVTSCHHAGACPTELFDVTPIAEVVAYHLLRNPINQDLPRKFKISFSGCRSECGLASIHDLGFIAACRENGPSVEPGFKLFVGGGLGSSPKLAKLYAEFLPLEELLPTCEAVLKIFDAHGDRKTKSKARMKFVVEKWGIEEFKKRVAEELTILKESGKTYPSLPIPKIKERASHPAASGGQNGRPKGTEAFEKWFRSNVIPQPSGLCTAQIKLVLGDATAEQLRGLAEIVERFSPQEIRATHQQNFIVHGLRQENLQPFHAALERIGLAGAGAERVVDVISCPGAESCQLALTSSMGLGRALVREFDENLTDFEDLNGLRLRISGCPNSCGHHHIAGIGFHGVGKKVNGKLAPHYQLHLGGGVSAEHSAIGKSKLKLPAKNIPAAVMEMITLYRESRAGEGETFNQFVERYGRDAVTARLERFARIPDPQQAPEYYKDFDDERDFSLDDLGPGECAGTVIDMIEHYLRSGSQAAEKAAVALRRGEYAEAVAQVRSAVMVCCRALLMPFGVDSPNEEEILKEFQHRVVEQALVTERFENFTEGLGKWAPFDPRPESVQALVELADHFVRECGEAYDRLDANLKLRKREPALPILNEVAMKLEKKADVQLDLSGVACPMNFVKTKLQLEEMDPGQLLEVILDDGEPIRNVPRSVEAEGHKIVEKSKIPDGHHKILIEKV